jgi:GTPase SAR1 family protein
MAFLFGASKAIWGDYEDNGKLNRYGSNVSNKTIEKQLIQEDKNNKIKVLLLGTGESGKSTLFKQMKIINISDYSYSEREAFRETICGNIIQDLRYVFEGAERLEYKPVDPEFLEIFTQLSDTVSFSKLRNPCDILTKQVAIHITTFWVHPEIRQLYSKRSEFYLNDSAGYFFDRVLDIIDVHYIPTNEDILRSRKRTTGVTELNFKVDGKHNFKFIDLGGQRSERKKWLKVFDDVTAVLFITSMSEFDQNLYEDDKKNRMVESIELFEEIVQLEHFKKTPIIIFFNKYDLFKEKIKTVNPSVVFPEYKDGCDEEKAKAFIKSKYMQVAKQRKEIFHHFTTATDTKLIETVFSTVKVIILRKILDQYNLL